LDSHLGPNPESDLVTDVYSVSTLIVNIDRSDYQISFNSINKYVISLSAVIGALSSPLVPHLESDLEIYHYFGSTPIAIKAESNRRISSRRLQEIYNIAIYIYTLAQPSSPI
jgi:hypothetical protein